jgi:hypothetical protein
MNAAPFTDIPDDLIADAAQVPGLRIRLISFLRAEVTQHRKRQNMHSLQAREIVRQAREEVAKMEPLAEDEKAQAKKEFVVFYERLMNQLK